MAVWENIGSGQSLSVEKNTAGGYDVILRTNQTVKSSYILLAHTTKLIQKGDRVQWE